MKVLIDGVSYIPEPKIVTDNRLLEALEVRFEHYYHDEITVRKYLRELLRTLWEQKDSFHGKRPFGYSGWEFDLMKPLAKAGFIDLGPLDENGYPYEWTDDQINKADAYVHDLILAMCHGVKE